MASRRPTEWGVGTREDKHEPQNGVNVRDLQQVIEGRRFSDERQVTHVPHVHESNHDVIRERLIPEHPIQDVPKQITIVHDGTPEVDASIKLIRVIHVQVIQILHVHEVHEEDPKDVDELIIFPLLLC